MKSILETKMNKQICMVFIVICCITIITPGYGKDIFDSNLQNGLQSGKSPPTTAKTYAPAPATTSDISINDNNKTITVMPSIVAGKDCKNCDVHNTEQKNDICDNDSTIITSFRDDCKIRMYGGLTPDNFCDTSSSNWGCSAAKVGPRSYVTAGHCFYGRDSTTLYSAKCGAIWCGKSDVPDNTPPEDWIAQMAWSSNWNDYVTSATGGIGGTPYDGAVFLAFTGTHPDFSDVADIANSGTVRMEITGYGGPPREDTTCHEGCYNSGWNGRQQRSDTKDGNTNLESTNGFYISKFDACPGHSGSGIWALTVNRYVGTLSASSCNSCENYVVPNRLASDTGCNNDQGGVSWNCLFAALGISNTNRYNHKPTVA